MHLNEAKSLLEQGSSIARVRFAVCLLLCTFSWVAQADNESSKLTASDGVFGDEFGWSVSTDGDRTIVGALKGDGIGANTGSAYVYERDANANFIETELFASDGAFLDNFGSKVSLNGNRAIVAAPSDDDKGRSSGSAYIYERDSSGVWAETKLVASDGNENDYFGVSVSIEGDRAIVGAYLDDDNGTDSGSVYVYERNANGNWTETKLLASDGVSGDRFGWSVSIDGDRAIVGAILDGDNGAQSGSAYLFERNAAGVWIESKLLASDGAAGDLFGRSVSIDGDRAIVGATLDDDNGDQSGSVYVYERDAGGNWVENKLTASDGAAEDYFGDSVSIHGNRAIVGAREDDDYGSQAGSAYVYERDANGNWTETKLLASDAATEDYFAWSVSIDSNRAVVGARLDDDNGTESGSAYVFEFSPQITAPVAGDVLTDPVGAETFEWIPGLANVSEWWLYLGNSPDGTSYYNSGSLSASTLSAAVSGLPSDASTIYATLWYRVQGDNTWYFIDASYTASGARPLITAPATGSALDGATQPFAWQDNGISVSHYWLDAGSSIGANDYFQSGDMGTSTSVIAMGLPSDGVSIIHVRLWYQITGSTTWRYIDESYTAGTIGAAAPVIDSPPPPGPFTSPSGTEVLNWADNGSGASEYWLFAGSSPGSGNYFDSGNLGSALSTTITGLPGNGTTVWIRLWYRSGTANWLYLDEEYTAAGNGPTIVSSSGTGVLTSPNDTFSWTDPNGTVTAWWLYLGSSAGSSDHESSGNLSGVTSSYTTINSNLPGGSEVVHARLWYQEGAGSVWQYMDKVFASAP